MTSAYILIAAILVLGGLIAALGDRLGTKIGKARLRLFNLRPRQTAIVMTVVTGVSIAASTLGILFALSKSLRQGVFQLDDILKKRRLVEAELIAVTQQKKQVEIELTKAKTQQQEAQEGLEKINKSFQQAQAQLTSAFQRAKTLDAEVKKLAQERQGLLSQRNQLKGQIDFLEGQTQKLNGEISQLQTQLENRDRDLVKKDRTISQQDNLIEQREEQILEKEQKIAAIERTLRQREKNLQKLQQEISDRDRRIEQLDQAIAAKDQNIQTRESKLKELEGQLEYLQRELAILEQYYQNYQVLRQGNVALLRGQVLAFAALRVVDPQVANKAIDQLLSQANRKAMQATRTTETEDLRRVVQITESQVNQLINQLKDGKDYVVRIISAGNYVQGERQVRVFADVAVNQQIFQQGEVIATISLDSEQTKPEEIQQRLDLLLSASQFRARRAGILGDIQVEDASLTTLVGFLENLKQSPETVDELKAIVADNTYTAGPLKLHLVALYQGKLIWQTEDPQR